MILHKYTTTRTVVCECSCKFRATSRHGQRVYATGYFSAILSGVKKLGDNLSNVKDFLLGQIAKEVVREAKGPFVEQIEEKVKETTATVAKVQKKLLKKEIVYAPTYLREFFEDNAEALDVKILDDFVYVPLYDYLIAEGDTERKEKLFSTCHSLHRAAIDAYPLHHWRPFNEPPTYDYDTLKKVFREMCKGYDVKICSDWYKIPMRTFHSNDRAFFNVFNECRLTMLRAMLPNYNWDPLKFKSRQKSSLSDVDDEREIMNNIAAKLGIATLEDWIGIPREMIMENGGFRVYTMYGPSVKKLLKNVYPKYPWNKIMSTREIKPRGFWQQESNIKRYLNILQGQARISKPEDWYAVPRRFIANFAGHGALRYYPQMLETLYPGYPFDSMQFSLKVKPKERIIYNYIKELYPHFEAYKDFEFQDLENNFFTANFAVYVPELKIGFIYQLGQQMGYEKQNILKNQYGVTVIRLPTGWDGSMEQFVNAVNAAKPRLRVKIPPQPIATIVTPYGGE